VLLRELTVEGIRSFSEFIADRRLDTSEPTPVEWLSDEALSRSIARSIEIGQELFKSRMDAAQYLNSCLNGLPKDLVDGNQGLWAWLGLLYFDQLCPLGKLPGEEYRYILVADGTIQELRHSYRHLLAAPYLIYRNNLASPPLALLCGPVSEHGEVAEQISSSLDFVTNPCIMEVANLLYLDAGTGTIKRGAGGRGPGSPRRFVAVLKQLDLTYDLYSLTPPDLLSLLPGEFDRFRP
jgi:hypothetical protein